MSAGRRSPKRLVILVSGSGSNLQAIIERTDRGEVEIGEVISDRPGVYALERARSAGIPASVVDYGLAGSRENFAAELARQFARLQPDLIALAGFMRILPEDLVGRFLGRMLNVHPSLLPRYPGLDTYRRALEAGDAWHGSTVHFVTRELDAGPAVIQYRLRVRPGDTEQSLRERVQRGEHLIYPQAIRSVATGAIEYREGQVWRYGAPAPEPLVVYEDPGEPAAGQR